MRVELTTHEIEEAIEDYFNKKGIRIKKDTITFEIDDYNLDAAIAELESITN